MLVTLAAMAVFLESIRLVWRDAEFRAIAMVAVVQVAVGTLVYSLVEDWSLLDSAYFCVVSLCTVGYGDLSPTTDFGKVFTIFYLLAGVGLFFTFVGKLASARVELRERQPLLRRNRRTQPEDEGGA
jgi:hypothetical protein